MPITKMDLKRWFDNGVKQKATHMIIAVDTFDYEDYPVYVLPEDDVHEKINTVRMAPMQRIMEIYDLAMDRTEQLNEHRSFHFPEFPKPVVAVPDNPDTADTEHAKK